MISVTNSIRINILIEWFLLNDFGIIIVVAYIVILNHQNEKLFKKNFLYCGVIVMIRKKKVKSESNISDFYFKTPLVIHKKA